MPTLDAALLCSSRAVSNFLIWFDNMLLVCVGCFFITTVNFKILIFYFLVFLCIKVGDNGFDLFSRSATKSESVKMPPSP